MSLRSIVNDIRDSLRNMPSDDFAHLTDFRGQKAQGAKMMLAGALKRLIEATRGSDLASFCERIARSEPKDMMFLLEQLAGKIVDEKVEYDSVPSFRLPLDVQEVINADLSELKACMKAGCYRSAIILCGRVMETALHRKYFESTGQDLLEKAPGIGLGNLIAKLAEKGVIVDPGLGNQIHLINQVRVFSVHTKQVAFAPSRMQSEAIVLYTLDILEKLFK